jgi:hypothetical protein
MSRLTREYRSCSHAVGTRRQPIDQRTSLKYAWEDKKGRRARGGELPIWALSQGVLFAAEHEYLSRKQMAQIAKGLIDRLAKS